MSRSAYFAFAAVVMSTSAVAQLTTLESDKIAQRGTGNPDKMICEITETTGTRLGTRKVCKTLGQWQEQREEHRQTLERVQRMNTSTGCPNGAVDC